jgi:protein TonB
MRAGSYQPNSYQYQASFRTRATSAALTLLVIALMILMLLRMGILPPIIREVAQPTMLKLLPPQKSGASPSHSAAKQKQAARSGSRHVPVKVAPTAKAPRPPVVPPPPVTLPWIQMSHEQFAASDIAKMPTHPAPTKDEGDGGDGSGSGNNSGSTYGPGEGPGGEQLFNVEWYRPPTDAELAFYLPKSGTGGPGYGEVACKMIDHYHVEDCTEIGETPGTGYARTVREAAWQFLVRPPRINGAPQIGKYVRIRITWTPHGVSESNSASR